MRYYKYPEVMVSLGGVATEAKQDIIINELQTLNTNDFATEGKQDDIISELQALNTADFATETTQNLVLTELENLNLVDYATEAKQDDIIAELQDISANTGLTIVDQIDTTPLLDVSVSNIPASSANSLQIVAVLAADVKKVISVEDIGEYIGLYSGPVATPTLLGVLPLGGGELDVEIPVGTLVSIRHMKNTAITSDYIAINFLG